MELIITHANLTDSWAVTHPPAPSEAPRRPSRTAAAQAMHDFGHTADSPLNTWSHSKPLDAVARKWLGKRLDYVLFRSPRPHAGPSLDVHSTSIVFTHKVPGRDFSYSDHFGLEAIFHLRKGPTAATTSSSTHNLTMTEGTDNPGDAEEERAAIKAPTEMGEESLLTAIGAITHEYRLSQARTKLHFLYFTCSVAVLFVVLFGSAWLPASTWVPPISTLLGALATWAGTTSLYIGLIFGKWERNMMTNIISELETLRGTAARRTAAGARTSS